MSSAHERGRRARLGLTLCIALTAAGARAGDGVPAWAYPLNPPAPADAPAYDRVRPLHVPGSAVTLTESELNDLFRAPDWFPHSHARMPEVVARGRAPDVYACGFCHTADGQGRPENASLAGLPAAYIMRQVEDFKSGARRSAWPGPYRPTDLMIHTATYASAEDIAAAANYFSQQSLTSHVRVLERARVPRSRVVGWVYVAIPGAGSEALGQRLMEFAPDARRHEHRDGGLRYVAYVPPGSLARGRVIAAAGAGGAAVACSSCHGGQLQGVGLVPRLAGRYPTYLLRQLLAFQSGARAGDSAAPMLPVVAQLNLADMIAVVAYAASLQQPSPRPLPTHAESLP